MIVLIGLTFLSLFTLLIYYVGTRLYFWMGVLGLTPPPILFHLVHFFFAYSYLLAYPLKRSRMKHFLTTLGAWWMGFFWYGLLLFAGTDLLGFLGRLLSNESSRLPHFFQQGVGLFLLLSLVLLLLVGRRNAQQLRVSSYRIRVPKRGSTYSRLSIALLSDLHLGAINGTDLLHRIKAILDKDPPDLLLLGGDLFDGDMEALSHPEEAAALLETMAGKLGSYACLGNHDAGKSFPSMLDFFKKADIHLLQDASVLVEDALILYGRKDLTPIGNQGKKRLPAEALEKVERTHPLLLLDHQPARLPEANALGADLLVSGHTHHGQIFPFSMVTRRIFTVDYGYYRDGPLQVVVSSGAGTWGPPLRLGTRSEVVRIELEMIE